VAGGGCTNQRTIDLGNGTCYTTAWCQDIWFIGNQLTQISCGIAPYVCQCEAYGSFCQVDICNDGVCYFVSAPFFCGTGGGGGGATQPDFSVLISPNIRIINQGENTSYDVTVNSLNNFSGVINLDVGSSCPQNANCYFSQNSINVTPNSNGSAVLFIETNFSINPASYSIQVNAVSNNINHNNTVQLIVNSQPLLPPTPTLSVSLSANPSSGNIPLTTNLTATVSGTAQGTINYTFWKNCSSQSTNISQVVSQCGNWDSKFDNENTTSKTVQFTYNQAGTYTPKVIVERGSASPAESRVTINVSSLPPPPPQQTSTNFSLSVNVSGSGRVTSSPAGINCPLSCSSSFSSGTTVTLSASPLPNNNFSNWSGDCSGSNPICSLIMNSNKSVRAVFNATSTCGDGICVSPEDMNSCPTDCPSHLKCQQGTCVKVPGQGNNECRNEGSRCQGNIREIPLKPPSLNQFLKQTASLFLIFK
jgi:hypothetical protein